VRFPFFFGFFFFFIVLSGCSVFWLCSRLLFLSCRYGKSHLIFFFFFFPTNPDPLRVLSSPSFTGPFAFSQAPLLFYFSPPFLLFYFFSKHRNLSSVALSSQPNPYCTPDLPPYFIFFGSPFFRPFVVCQSTLYSAFLGAPYLNARCLFREFHSPIPPTVKERG